MLRIPRHETEALFAGQKIWDPGIVDAEARPTTPRPLRSHAHNDPPAAARRRPAG
jgi:hypothetical protein